MLRVIKIKITSIRKVYYLYTVNKFFLHKTNTLTLKITKFGFEWKIRLLVLLGTAQDILKMIVSYAESSIGMPTDSSPHSLHEPS